MKRGIIAILAVVVVIVILIGTFAGTYNGLVRERENVRNSFQNIDAQLQRRADLIPNLVETVKGFAAQERAVIDSVTNARAKLAGAQSVDQKAEANTELSGALGRLLVIVENYPQLKSDANFRQLMDELAGTENRIAVARLDYNNQVRLYNTRVRTFPTNLIAGLFGFGQEQYFQAAAGSETVPTVSFGGSWLFSRAAS